jgi:lysyl-tRNA synthetase class II
MAINGSVMLTQDVKQHIKHAIERKEEKIVDKKSAFAIDMDFVANYMDDDIREKVHYKFAPCSDKQFIREYCKEHEKKFGKRFEIDGVDVSDAIITPSEYDSMTTWISPREIRR